MLLARSGRPRAGRRCRGASAPAAHPPRSTAVPSRRAPRGRRSALPTSQIADAPCRGASSRPTGRMVRRAGRRGARRRRRPPSRRSKHDAVRSAVDATTRGDIGRGDEPRAAWCASPPSTCRRSPATRSQLARGHPVADQYLGLERDEHVVALVPLAGRPAARRRHRAGRRSSAWPRAELGNKHDIEIIALQATDDRSSAPHRPCAGAELVFVASDSRSSCSFDASSVRPQGARPCGMAGHPAHPDGARSSSSAVVGAPDVRRRVVRARSPAALPALPAPTPASAKVSLFSEFPGKGRATGGVRAQPFLRGEDALTDRVGGHGSACHRRGRRGPRPAGDGAKRDASGTALDGVIGAVGTGLRRAGPALPPAGTRRARLSKSGSPLRGLDARRASPLAGTVLGRPGVTRRCAPARAGRWSR